MNKFLLALAIGGCGLNAVQALPVLTLTERNDTTLDWAWSDGTGSGTAITTTPDLWTVTSFPFPTGVIDSFYGRWQETFPGYRNDVYIPYSAGGLGTLYVSSDLVDFSPSLAPLGTALTSYDLGSFQVVFNDMGDHIVETPDSGPGSWAMAATLGAVVLIRRRMKSGTAA